MSPLDAPRLAGHFALTAIPDTVDFRDRMFEPTLIEVPIARPYRAYVDEMCGAHEILDQGADGACTGFALAAVAQYLLATRDRRRNGDGSCHVPAEPVSPWMFYGMAQRYDEWPGEDYSGSSARGAMKAWHRHGVCRRDLWAHLGDVSASEWAARWADARQRPLGAYYRVNHKDLVAMHAALAEVGVLFATAHVHEGWLPDELRGPEITPRPNRTGAHAFTVVGYRDDGFWIQNSWGPGWGEGGFGILPYDDWLRNGLDVWVARLGAPVRVSATPSGAAAGVTVLGRGACGYSDLRPHVVSLGNDGRLRATGTYGTDADAVERLFEHDVRTFVRDRAEAGAPAHLLLYAHGGLVDEDTAIERLTDLRAPLLEHGVYPISFIWKTDFWSTLSHILEEAILGRRPEGVLDAAQDFLLDRLDDALEPVARASFGKAQWDEMKENAVLATASNHGGARWAAASLSKHVGPLVQAGKLRVHVVAHSAGSIFMAPLVRLLTAPAGRPITFDDLLLSVGAERAHARDGAGPTRGSEAVAGRAIAGGSAPTRDPVPGSTGLGFHLSTCTLWAPACTLDLFARAYLPALEAGRLGRFGLFTLADAAEQDDHCAHVYHKSLLYLVSNALEERPRIPIFRDHGEPLLGMARWVEHPSGLFGGRTLANLLLELPGADWVSAPTPGYGPVHGRSAAASHGAFDDDIPTLQATLARILAAGTSAQAAGRAAARATFAFNRSSSSRRAQRRDLQGRTRRPLAP